MYLKKWGVPEQISLETERMFMLVHPTQSDQFSRIISKRDSMNLGDDMIFDRDCRNLDKPFCQNNSYV